jgi:hypothetical protein
VVPRRTAKRTGIEASEVHGVHGRYLEVSRSVEQIGELPSFGVAVLDLGSAGTRERKLLCLDEGTETRAVLPDPPPEPVGADDGFFAAGEVGEPDHWVGVREDELGRGLFPPGDVGFSHRIGMRGDGYACAPEHFFDRGG